MSAAYRAFVVVSLSVLAIMGVARPAWSGTNGQNISFRVLGQIERVKISGDNENGHPIIWDSARFEILCNAGRCDQVRTNNWWFKGKIIIEYSLKGDRTPYSCHFYVNERQGGNWVNLFEPGDDPSTGRPLANRDPGAKCLTSRLDAIVEVLGKVELPPFIRARLRIDDGGRTTVADIGSDFAASDAGRSDLPVRRLYGAGHFNNIWVVAMELAEQGEYVLRLYVFESGTLVREMDAGYARQPTRKVDGQPVSVFVPFKSIVAKYLLDPK